VDAITTPAQRQAVAEYQAQAARKSDRERTDVAKKKTGVFTGARAINPVDGESIPIWIADYVLISYGTGAIMAVPAHDERDFEFALQFGLPIRPVVLPPEAWFKDSKVYHLAEENLASMDARFEIGPAQRAASAQPATLDMKDMGILNKIMALWDQADGNLLKAITLLYTSHAELFAEAFTGDGSAINSGGFNGLSTAAFKEKIIAWLEVQGKGQRKVNYKLRDWLFSRQRYWGEPFPLVHELDAAGNPTGVVEPLAAEELPLRLPEIEDYKPSGRPEPLLGKVTDWVFVNRGGKCYKRETNTMPQWAGSCWYYLRYLDAKNDQCFCDPAKERAWMPVDLYVGGAEHAVLHLLYARFWHKVLFDRGHVHTPEPFQRLVNQGMILGENQFFVTAPVFQANEKLLAEKGLTGIAVTEDDGVSYALMNKDEAGKLSNLSDEQVEKRKGTVYLAGTNLALSARAEKMSKSRGNVINPDEVVEEFGADSLRLYEMFMGPLEATKPWSMRGVEGVFRFLNRVWRLLIDDRSEDMKLATQVQDVPPDKDTLRMLHQTIKRVSDDLESMSFNTAIAAMMEFANFLTKQEVRPRSALETFVLLLSPFAPHLGEELWQALGHAQTLAYEPWPGYDEALIKAESIEVPVQINGKLRTKLTVPADIDKAALEMIALADDKVRGLIDGKKIKKVIVVPGKLVNIVVG
jgi:leucyl-tRNA synthetase